MTGTALPYTPESLTLAILTVNRKPEYIHQTLASLFAADPDVHRLGTIHVMVGSTDASYLRRYGHHERLNIVPLTPAEGEEIRDWHVHRKFCHNYHRCLTVPMVRKRGIIVCEDDIMLRDHFVSRLLDTIWEMEVEHGLKRYALALFSSHDFENDNSFYRGRLYCSYGYPFFGTQCMYYPRECAAEIAPFLLERGVKTCEAPGDLLVKQVYGDKMYACCRGLAQHVGDVSTGLGGGGRSDSFDRPYRPIPAPEWGAKT